MKLSEAIKPLSYFKSHASELIRDITDNQRTMIITQNGEAKIVLQDIKIYEQIQESLALLKILTMSNHSLKRNKVKPVADAFKQIRKRITESQAE